MTRLLSLFALKLTFGISLGPTPCVFWGGAKPLLILPHYGDKGSWSDLGVWSPMSGLGETFGRTPLVPLKE